MKKMENKEENKEKKQAFFGMNRFRLLMIIFFSALATVLYVNNVLQINHLLKENQALSKNLINLKNNNELLRSELNKLESPERIISVATNSLGMVKSSRSPKILNVKTGE